MKHAGSIDTLREGEAAPSVLAPGLVGLIRPGSALCARSDPREWLAGVPPGCLRSVAGRETFAWPFAPADARAQVIVKRTHGDVGRMRTAGRREFEILEELARDGFPVPRALAWCEDRAGRASALRKRRSCVVMERIPHAATLREQLARAALDEQARLGRALLELVVRLHERGWYHRDLYLQHLVVPESPTGTAASAPIELILLDVARARRAKLPRRRWFVKDLAALLHSTPRVIGARARLRFLATYLDRRGVASRGERRRWLRQILAKQSRMAAHRPRAGEDRPWQDL